MPSVSCILVKQHAVHGGPCIGFLGCPAIVSDLLQMMLGGPHPSLVTCYVIPGRPPTFGFIVIYDSSKYKYIMVGIGIFDIEQNT